MRAVGNLKECSRCRRVLALDAFAKDRNRVDGLYTQCKDCEREYRNKNRGVLLEKKREGARRHYEANREVVLKRNAQWRSDNPDIQRERSRRYREEHKEAIAMKDSNYRSRNADRIKQQGIDYYHANSKKIKERILIWRRDNPERYAEQVEKRRARKAGAAVEEADFKRIWKRDRGVCYLCGRSVDKKDVHYDHVIPLSRGGAHSEENLRVTHGRCNLIKGAKLVEELDMSRFK